MINKATDYSAAFFYTRSRLDRAVKIYFIKYTILFNSQIEKPKVSIEELDEEIENVSVTLENAIFDIIAHDEVMAFINRLPTRQRDVIIFHCLYDLSIDETAQRLNISLATVNKHLMLARKAIRAFVDERRNG